MKLSTADRNAEIARVWFGKYTPLINRGELTKSAAYERLAGQLGLQAASVRTLVNRIVISSNENNENNKGERTT